MKTAAPSAGAQVVAAAATPDSLGSDALIRQLGLERNIGELEMQGYTVVPNAVPLDLVDRLRDRILAVAEEDRDAGVTTMNFGERTQLVWRVLLRGVEFEQAITVPAIHALMWHLLGGGYRLNVVNSSVLWEGAKPQTLHSDNVLIPDPFPAWALTATAVIPCDDFTDELGATQVVPASHKLLRHPRKGEGEGQFVAIEAPKGSVVVWNGSLWHRSGRRSAPGERVVFHANFARLHIATYESYLDDLDGAAFERNPPHFRQMMGGHAPWNLVTRWGPDQSRLAESAALFQQR